MRRTGNDQPLFAADAPRHPIGRVRRGLDLDVQAATAADTDLSHAGVAALRSLADQIDQLERQLRSPRAKPYDRIPLAGLVREFRETYDQTFAVLASTGDPLTRALHDFLATDRATDAGTGGAPASHPDNRPG